LVLKNFLNLAMHTARMPPVNPAPATITAVFATHTGHISPSLSLWPPSSITWHLLLAAEQMRRTGAPSPWRHPCATPRRWTENRGRERCRLLLSPTHRRSLAPPTRARPSGCQSLGSYRCRWDPETRHGLLRPGRPAAPSGIASCWPPLPSKWNTQV